MATTNRQFLIRTGLSLPAGTSAQAPLTFQPGVNISTIAAGSVEWDGYNLYISENKTNGTSSSAFSTVTRRTIAYTDSTMTPLIGTITAAGTTQATATDIITDYAYVNSSSAATAPYNGVTLPSTIQGRTVSVVNNTANPINVYPPQIISSLSTVNSNGLILTITGGSTTDNIYPGMLVTYISGTSGAFVSNTVVTSILSSTTFSISDIPTTALVNATISVGIASGINALTNDAAFTMVPYTSVSFIAVTTSKWISSSAAPIAANNGSGGGSNYTPGSVMYASDAFGTLAGISPISTAGIPLLSGGTNTAPSYTAINLSNSGTSSSNTVPAYGILPVANGGTGTNGSGLNSASATYSLVNSTSTTINFGNAATTIGIGASTGTTTINNNLAVTGTSILTGNTTITGNLTVSGTQFIANTTNTAISDSLIELHKPTTGWLLSDDGYDVGIKYHYYKTSSLFVVTNTTGNGTTTTLTLSDSSLIIPIGTVIAVGSTLSPVNGTYVVSASSPGSVSFASSYNSTMATIGTVAILQSISMTSATSSSTTVTVYYAASSTLISTGSTVSLTGFSNTSYNGTYTVVTAGAGSFTVTTVGSNLGTTNAATGSIIVSDLYSFTGWANDSSSFEFYTEGYENNGTFTGQYGNIKAGSFQVSAPSSITATNIGAGAIIRIPTGKFYDTSSNAAAVNAQASTVSVGQYTVGSLNTNVTYTNASSLYIANAPVAGSNVTITNPYAIQVASGNTLLGGNLAVNGGTLSTTSTTFTLLNANVTTLNALSAVQTVNVGGASTTAYSFGGSTSGSTFTIGGAAATGNSVSINGTTGGTISLSTPVTTGTANIFNTVTGAINIGGAGTTVNVGTTGGASTLKIQSNGTATISTSGTTASLFDSIATTVNAFGSATSINLASNATSTLTFGTATSANTSNIIKIAANGGSAEFDASSTTGTATLFNSVTAPVYIGGATTTVRIGASAATVTIGNGGNSTLTISGGSGSAATINTNAGVTTASVFNTVVTTGNLFGAATTLNIANTTTAAITGSIGTSSTAGSTYTFGGAITSGTNAIKIGAAAGGIASFDASTATATGALFTTVTGTVNIGGAGSTVNFGSTSTDEIVNINSSVTATLKASTATTLSLFNTVTTTVNAFGVSTAVNIASSVATGTASTMTYGSAVTAGVINTIKINTNGGVASFDAAATTATAMLFNSVSSAITVGSTSGTTTVNSPNVYIGVASADNTLTVNGNGTTGTATISSNVTTGNVNLFTGTTGTITIGGPSISSGLGVVKLGTSPSQLATGNEVVTANWVLNNINSTASTSVNTGTNVSSQLIDSVTGVAAGSFVVGASYTISSLGTTTNAQWNTIAGTSNVTYNVGSTFVAATTGASSGTGTAYTGQAFNWYQYRSAKYTIQATQVGSTSTRAQTSEILITHDAPVLVFTGATAANTTTLTVVSNSGLYVGMSLMITINGGGPDIINGSATGVTTITAISGTTVTLANASTITSGSTLKAYVATSFSASITAANSTTSVTYAGMTGIVGCAYPGMYITGTGVTANTYITSINKTTGTITLNQALATAAGAVISGTPNVYVTEYAVLETNGTIGIFTAAPTTTAPYHIQLTTTPLNPNSIVGTLVETVFKLEKQLIELV